LAEHQEDSNMLIRLPRLLVCLFVVGVLQSRVGALGLETDAGAQRLSLAASAQQPDASPVFKPGSGVELPRVKKEVRPKYTADARARRIQGVVWIEAVVLPDGKVGEVAVTKSLDSVYGLDRQALHAARKWRFAPGRHLGKPVPVLVTIEMTFTLK